MESEDHPLIPKSRKRRTWSVIAWATVWLLALTACGTGDPPQGTVGFIVIEPGAVLLTAAGETVQLRATVFDGAGNPVDLPVTWHSVTPTVVTVDGEGLATAATGLGSSQIVARTDSLESPPLLVIVAPVVEGAVLVRDEQVVDGPVAVDDLADYGPGWRYAVTLAGVPALVPGDLLVGTGAIALGGRVVGVVEASGGVRVTLEIVGLDELFTALEINETLDLLHARPEFDDEVLAAYDVARHPDGSIEFVPRTAAASLVLPAQVTGVRALGVFNCTTTTTFPFSLPKAPQFTITPTVKMQLDYSLAAGLRKLGAEGAVKAEFKFEPKVSASFEGKLECEVELMAFPIPVGGPIALVIGGQVPIGVGFELQGKLVVAELGLDVNATGTATFGMGIACPEGDCEPYATGSLTVDPKVTPKLPNVDEQLRLTFSIEPFAFADLALGARSFKRLRIQLLRFTLGASQKFDLATATAQVADPAYASTFDLRALLKAKLGGDITRALALLKVTIKPLEVTLIDLLLAESPRGTFTIEPATVRPTTAEADGDLATFTVTLSPTTYLSLEVIDRVEFRWLRGGALGEGRPACSVLPASPGQSTFSCTTDFLEEHEGLQTFYAFVYVKLFGIPLAIPLEINKDARATVEVIRCLPTSTTPNALRPTSDHEQCTDQWTREFAKADISTGVAVAIDVHGNAYVAGLSYTTTAESTSVGGNYLAKFSPQGEEEWIRTTSRFRGMRGYGVAADQNGSVYTSVVDSLYKYDAMGDLLWSATLESAIIGGMALDDDGGVYIVGITLVSPPLQNTYFVANFDALSGELRWKRDFDAGEAMAAVVHEGALFVVGQIVVMTANDGVFDTEYYGFLAKHGLASGDQLLTPTTFRGVVGDHGNLNLPRAIAARPDGTLLVAGQTNGSLVAGQNNGRMDAFMALFDAVTLTRSLIVQFGTPEYDRATGVAWDADGNAIVVGETYGDLGGSNAGNADAFIARFDRSGAFIGYQQAGSVGLDVAEGVAVDDNGNLFVTGRSASTSSFLSKGWVQIGP